MTKEKLQRLSKLELVNRAKRKKVPDYRSLRKDELIDALAALLPVKKSRHAKKLSRHTQRSAKPNARPVARKSAQRKKPAPPRIRPQLAAAHNSSNGTATGERAQRSSHDNGVPTRDLSAKIPKDLPKGHCKDRIVAMVRDPYWLHCYWELTRQSVQRAEAALAQAWHGACPILRLLDVTSADSTCTAERVVKDVEIHGGANNWYIEVENPPRSYRVDIGYLSRGGQFYVLARSNVVSTPRAGMTDTIDGNWSDLDSERARRIFAMSTGFDPSASSLELKQLFEERLRRPMGSPALTGFGAGALQFGKPRTFWFEMDAELIVYGATEPTAKVVLQGEPVKLRRDGTFTMRFSLPDSRQIIPAVAMSADGVEERTVVLAVERNTKHLEPVINEVNE